MTLGKLFHTTMAGSVKNNGRKATLRGSVVLEAKIMWLSVKGVGGVARGVWRKRSGVWRVAKKRRLHALDIAPLLYLACIFRKHYRFFDNNV